MDPQPNLPPQQPRKPQLKVRGLDTGLTFKERLRQFKKKDLAFILAGLAVLFLAPLAEHFLLGPEETPGGPSWISRGGTALWPGNALGNEGGTGFAPGGPAGGAPELITPLNARDPSALVMGPGATQQPPAGSGAPQTAAAPQPSVEELKNALAGSAARGVGTGVKQAVPHIALAGSGLRGLSAVTGGFNASAGAAPSSAGLVGGRPSLHGGLTSVRPVTGYRGAEGARGLTSGSSPDGLHKAAEAAAGYFNRAGSATGGLQAAAQSAIPTGGTSFGGGHLGGRDFKFPGGGGPDKFSHSLGSLLAFDLAKKLQEGRIERQLKEEEENDPTLQLAKLRNKFMDTMASKYAETIVGITGDTTKGFLKGKPSYIGVKCENWPGAGGDGHTPGPDYPAGFIPASAISDAPKDLEAKNGSPTAFYFVNGILYLGAVSNDATHIFGTGCQTVKSDASLGGDEKKKKDEKSGPLFLQAPDLAKLGNACKDVTEELKGKFDFKDTVPDYYKKMAGVAHEMILLRRGLYGGAEAADAECEQYAVPSNSCAPKMGTPSVTSEFAQIVKDTRGENANSEYSFVGTLQGAIRSQDDIQEQNQKAQALRSRFKENKDKWTKLAACFGTTPRGSGSNMDNVTTHVTALLQSLPGSITHSPEAKAHVDKIIGGLKTALGQWENVNAQATKDYENFDKLLNTGDGLLGCTVRDATLSSPLDCAGLGKSASDDAHKKKGTLGFIIGTNATMMNWGRRVNTRFRLPDITPAPTGSPVTIGKLVGQLKTTAKYIMGCSKNPSYDSVRTEPKKQVEYASQELAKVYGLQQALLQSFKPPTTGPDPYPTEQSIQAHIAAAVATTPPSK